MLRAVLASMKVRNLKANHNGDDGIFASMSAVLASMKVRNLKANHNRRAFISSPFSAVLASMKVRNLKANHNVLLGYAPRYACCISKYEGTESES